MTSAAARTQAVIARLLLPGGVLLATCVAHGQAPYHSTRWTPWHGAAPKRPPHSRRRRRRSSAGGSAVARHPHPGHHPGRAAPRPTWRLPGPERVFRLESEEDLLRRMCQDALQVGRLPPAFPTSRPCRPNATRRRRRRPSPRRAGLRRSRAARLRADQQRSDTSGVPDRLQRVCHFASDFVLDHHPVDDHVRLAAADLGPFGRPLLVCDRRWLMSRGVAPAPAGTSSRRTTRRLRRPR